jgi:cell division protein ZapA
MAQVTIEINARSYSVGCDDGEEEHLQALARYVDTKVRELAQKVGPVGETRLFMLAALMLADELSDAYVDADSDLRDRDAGVAAAAARASDAEAQGKSLQDRLVALERRQLQREEALTRHLDRIAERLGAVANRLAPG